MLAGGHTWCSLPGGRLLLLQLAGKQVPFSWVGHLTEFVRLICIKVGFTKHILGLDDLTTLTL